MKNGIKYIIFIIVVICCAGGLTMSYLHAHYKETGEINISKKYYDIMFTNAIVSGSDTSIKIDNDNDSIHFDIHNFSDKVLLYSIDLINIGNVDVNVDSISYTNVDTNFDKNDVKITTSISKGDLVKGGEQKKLNVTLEYLGNNKIENNYYNFNINFVFEKVSI